MHKIFDNFQNFKLKNYLSQEVEQILCLEKVDDDQLLFDENLWTDSINCVLNINYLANKTIILNDDLTINFTDTNINLTKYLGLIKSNLVQNFDPNIHSNLFFDNELNLFKSLIFDNLNNKSSQTIDELVYLSIFPIFERCLGNLLFSINGNNKSKIPFLLRDLVNDSLLENLLEKNLINFIKLLFYTPKSLNLRNLCWHGFFNPEHFNLNYVYFLIALISNINIKLKNVTIKSRPKFCLDTIQKLWLNKNLNLFESFRQKFETNCLEIIQQSVLIDDCRRDKWKFIYTRNNLTNFSLLTLLLPELEHILRKLYSITNNLESNDSVLIAYTNEFYLTLDDLLAWNRPDNQQNLLVNTIEKNLCVLLFDLINYIDGPRLRDHLSHGELDHNIPDFYVNILSYICIRIASLFSENELNLHVFSHKANSVYECNFHPIKILKLEALRLVESEIYLENYQDDFVQRDVNFLEWDFEDSFKLIYRYETLNDGVNSTFFKSIEFQFINLFRSILKEIQKYLLKLNEKKLFNEELSQNQNLRERQRNSLSNFQIFWGNFKIFYNCYVRIICLIIEKYVYSKNELVLFDFYNSDSCQKLLKLLKNNLKIFQNLSSHCEANKWIESKNMIVIRKEDDTFIHKLICYI